jgi:hypothetical protein
VLAGVRRTISARTDTTAIMEAHAAPGNRFGQTGGYRFVYHRRADGSWAHLR